MTHYDSPKAPPAFPSTSRRDEAQLGTLNRRRVLAADDMPEIRYLIARFLQRHGYDVTTAQDGREAWRLFRQAPYDLVITDLNMPEMDGAALIARIKAMAPETPVVVITGQLRGAGRGMAGGIRSAEAVLTKPFDFETLLKTVAALVAREVPAAAMTITM